jgi:hypothetical protein
LRPPIPTPEATVFRAAPCLLLALVMTLTAPGAPAAKEQERKGPPEEEIKKAIADLGSKRFAVRDKAKKFLQEAGSSAEALLEEAARNPDEEIASTAKSILERFQWGLYPDTPKDVRELIEQFRSGGPPERQAAVGQLMKQKPVPFATIRKLLAKEDNAEAREQMFANLYNQVREAMPLLLGRGDRDGAEELFELILTGSPANAGHDYATFMYLRGRVDPAIARFERERKQKGEKGERAAEVLVYLYRVKGDWAAARKAADDSKKDDLVERVLWQAGDWKALSTYSYKPDFGNLPGLLAAYERLAGNAKAFNEKMNEIRKSADDANDDKPGLRLDADALLLNGRPDEAIKVLADKKKELALVFDLLCARMKHKEAFALVDDARRRDTDPAERSEIEIRRARMLHLLGEHEAALQLFGKIAEDIKGRDNMTLARNLVRAESRVGLRDLAAKHAAESVAQLQKAGQIDGFGDLFEPVFGDDKDLAQAWWRLFRKEKPDEAPADAMKRIREIIAGKLDRKALDEWAGKMAKFAPDKVDLDRRGIPIEASRSFNRGFDAVAAAYRAAGEDTKAEEFYKKAAAQSPSMERWLSYGDFLARKKRYRDAAEAYSLSAKQAGRPIQEIEFDGDSFAVIEDRSPALPTYLQARMMTLAGDATEGKRLAEIAHWLPLGNEVVRAKLVDELNKRDLPEWARTEADLVVKTGWYQNYTYGNVLSYLAREEAKAKNFFKSAEYYEKCIAGCLRTGASFVEPTAYLIVPEAVHVYRARGLLAAGKIEEAYKEVTANLAAMPGNVELAIKIVPDLEKLGKKKEADAVYETVRGSFEKLIKDYPNSGYARNSAAWVMANCRRDLGEALKHAQKATELEPKNSGYLDTLAEVHFRKGDREQALAVMKKCAEIDPKNGYFRKQLQRFAKEPIDSPTPDEEEED